MKLKLSLALGLLALALSPLTARAEVQTFDQFVVDIPPDWNTEFKSGDGDGYGANLFISKEDQSAMVSYTMEKLNGIAQWEAMIKEMTDHPKPDTGPAQVTSASTFLVTFTDSSSGLSGKETYYRIDDSRYVTEVAIGYADDLAAIMKSFQIDLTPPEDVQE